MIVSEHAMCQCTLYFNVLDFVQIEDAVKPSNLRQVTGNASNGQVGDDNGRIGTVVDVLGQCIDQLSPGNGGSLNETIPRLCDPIIVCTAACCVPEGNERPRRKCHRVRHNVMGRAQPCVFFIQCTRKHAIHRIHTCIP